MRIGVVDAGSNSFLLLMAEKQNGEIKYFFDTSRIVGLGHLENGKVREQNLEMAVKVVKEYVSLCKSNFVDKTVITGSEIFRKIDKKYFDVLAKYFDESHILTREEEAFLSYRSVIEDKTFELDPLVVDIGGGSFEIAWREKGFEFLSIPMGAIFITDKFVKSYPIDDQLEIVKKELNLDIPHKPVVSIGGTGTTVASIIEGKSFDPTLIHGKFLSFQILSDLFDKMKKMTLEQITSLSGMEKGRERIITSGLFLLLEILERSACNGLYVSTRGHRYTIARDVLEGKKYDNR